jgi:Flagellar hook-length control protein FliK
VNLEAALAPAPTPSAGPAPNAGAPPGSSPPSGAPPFHSALAEHWARTAQAEGQSQEDSHSSHHERTAVRNGAQAGEAGLVAASLEGQNAVSGEAAEAAKAAAADAGAQAPGSTVGANQSAKQESAKQQGATQQGDMQQGDTRGPLTEAGEVPQDASPGSATLLDRAGDPSGANASGGPSMGGHSTGGESTSPSNAEGAEGVTGIPVLGPDRWRGARGGSGLLGTNVLASGNGSRGASAPASDDPPAAPSQPLAPQGGGVVGVPVGVSPTREAPSSAAGQQEQTSARALRLSTDGGAGGIDVSRSSRSSRLLSGPLGHGASPAKDALAGGARDGAWGLDGAARLDGAAGLAAPGSIESEADSLLSTSTAAPVAASTAGATAAPVSGSGVGMQDMIESIGATIELAARQGAAQARIALHPQDLGHISIRLSQTGNGLLARVNADTPAAAQALADGRAELHQTLSSLGVTLLRLDIGSFTQSGAGEREQSAGGQGGSSASGEADGSEETDGAQAPVQTTAPAGIGAGELVDVLA